MRHGYRVLVFGVAAGIAVACASGNKSTTGPGGTGGTAANIVKVSGDSQSAPFAAALPKPLVVKVTDSAGNAVSNSSVAWLITLDGTAQTQQITSTNNGGETQIAPMLGGTPGAFSVTAAINAHSVTFTGTSNLTFANGLKNLQGGEFASCGLTAHGAAFCWGDGKMGNLGNGDTTTLVGPQPVSGGHVFTQLSIGPHLNCGIAAAGALYCWGDPQYGEMGNGSSTGSPILTPTQTGNGMAFSVIAMGDGQACGISSGTTYCWGNGARGALGNGDSVNHYSPVAVHAPVGVAFISLASGWGYNCGLTSAGAAYCWGSNTYGRLGIGDSATADAAVPTAVVGGHVFKQIVAGSIGVCGLTSAGAVYCWGSSVDGNGSSTNEYSPTAINQSGLTFTQITMAGVHACGLTTTGAAYCWGDNGKGELGAPGSGSTPVAVSGGYTFNTIVAGSLTTCGYTSSHAMYCWGDNSLWQIGLGITPDSVYTTPQAIPGLQ